MSLLVYLVVTFGFAGLALALRARRRSTTVVGILGLAAAVVAVFAIEPGQSLVLGGGGLATTADVRVTVQ